MKNDPCWAPVFPPSTVEIRTVDFANKEHLNVQLLHGNLTLLDWFAKAIAGGVDWNDTRSWGDSQLDEATAGVWRIARSFIRTRPTEELAHGPKLVNGSDHA